MLLDVEGATTWMRSCQPTAVVIGPSRPLYRGQNPALERIIDVPQRLHSVCVLLWRFPKLEVPFAVSHSQSRNSISGAASGKRRTHFESGTARSKLSAIEFSGSSWGRTYLEELWVSVGRGVASGCVALSESKFGWRGGSAKPCSVACQDKSPGL